MTCMLVRVRECRQVPDHLLLLCFFLFKQKTAYEMRISDWSSVGCSSDLLALVALASLPGVVSGAESASAAAANGVIVVLVALGLLIAFGGIGASMQLDRARGVHPDEAVDGARAVLRILIVFALVTPFWSLFDQKASTWVLQGEDMAKPDWFSAAQMQALNPILVMLLIPFNNLVLYPLLRRAGLEVNALRRMGAGIAFTGTAWIAAGLLPLCCGGGRSMSTTWQARADRAVLQGEDMAKPDWFSAAQMQALNPILVMLLIPFNNLVLYPLRRRAGMEVTALRRMGAGIAFSGTAWIAAGMLQLWMDGGDAVSITWQVLPYALLTMGEVLVSATGLEFAYSQAPRSMKGVIMSFWLLSVSYGNLWVLLTNAAVRNEAVTTRIAETGLSETAFLMFFFAIFAFIAAAAFAWYARRYPLQDHYRS